MALRWCGVPGTATYNTDVDLRHKNYCVWTKLWNTVWPYVSIVNVYMQKDIVYVVRLGKRLSRDENQSLCQNQNFSFRLRNTGNTGIPAYQEESRKILFLCIYFRKWKQNIDFISEREFNILLSLSETKCRETNSFCFLPGSFNRYAGISCSPKAKTEILVLAQTFVFVSAQPLVGDFTIGGETLQCECESGGGSSLCSSLHWSVNAPASLHHFHHFCSVFRCAKKCSFKVVCPFSNQQNFYSFSFREDLY